MENTNCHAATQNQNLHGSSLHDDSSASHAAVADISVEAPATISLLGQTLTLLNGQYSGGLGVMPHFLSEYNNNSNAQTVAPQSLMNRFPVNQQNTGQLSTTTFHENNDFARVSQQSSSQSALMNALNLLQQNIGALQALVPLMAENSRQNGIGNHQQQATSEGIAAVISQLAVAAAGILPQVAGQQQQQQPQRKDTQPLQIIPGMQQGNQNKPHLREFAESLSQGLIHQNASQYPTENGGSGGNDEADGYVETLEDGTYDVVEMDPVEILAEHTHFCEICGKGFKRDANLRMHMRGHGDEYKSAAALSRPDKLVQDLANLRPKRFSCPYTGCKRNKKHKKFQPLKTMLCVKNHYRRSHCPKMLTCSKCGQKKFSVVADLKTHEKHCGRDKWMCSCGTTFSRKDKLLGHLSLFAGHTPAMPLHIMEEGINSSGHAQSTALGAVPGSLNNKTAGSQNEDTQGNSLSLFGNGNYLSTSNILQGLFTANFLDSSGSGFR